MEEGPEEKEDYLTEHFNLAFILRGHVKDLEAVKEYIVTEYVRKNTLEDPGSPSRLKRELAPDLTWGEDQWKIYSILNQNMQKTVTASPEKVLVRFETYVE